MLTREQLRVVSNFLLDAAKIIFGSLVVGVFVPAVSRVPWLTVFVGLTLTAAFLTASVMATKITPEKT